jgi:hypothetical protein
MSWRILHQFAERSAVIFVHKWGAIDSYGILLAIIIAKFLYTQDIYGSTSKLSLNLPERCAVIFIEKLGEKS